MESKSNNSHTTASEAGRRAAESFTQRPDLLTADLQELALIYENRGNSQPALDAFRQELDDRFPLRQPS
jgi:hypothetical protein